MCDIYYAKCHECDSGVDTHLGDYATRRDEVMVFCDQHSDLSDKPECGWRTEFAWKGDDGAEHRAAVVALTENAKANWDCNHPNESADMRFRHYEDGKLVGEGQMRPMSVLPGIGSTSRDDGHSDMVDAMALSISSLQPDSQSNGLLEELRNIREEVVRSVGIPSSIMGEMPMSPPSWKTFPSLTAARASTEPSHAKVFIHYPSGVVMTVAESLRRPSLTPTICVGTLGHIRSFRGESVFIPVDPCRRRQPDSGIVAFVRCRRSWVLVSSAETFDPKEPDGPFDPDPPRRLYLPAKNNDWSADETREIVETGWWTSFHVCIDDGHWTTSRDMMESDRKMDLLVDSSVFDPVTYDSPSPHPRMFTPDGQEISYYISAFDVLNANAGSARLLTITALTVPLNSRFDHTTAKTFDCGTPSVTKQRSKEEILDTAIIGALDRIASRTPTSEEIEDLIGYE